MSLRFESLDYPTAAAELVRQLTAHPHLWLIIAALPGTAQFILMDAETVDTDADLPDFTLADIRFQGSFDHLAALSLFHVAQLSHVGGDS
jgi:hypothetical protein